MSFSSRIRSFVRALLGRSNSTTVEIDPARVGRVRLSYAPRANGTPDPGEVVWTWVPFEERDGRGKDRPVLIVARERGGSVLAVALTSRNRTGDSNFVALGTGPWDRSQRASWADTDRVFRVPAAGMRREGASVDAARYARVATALRARYDWA